MAVKTPHAAVIVWNYDDKFGSTPSKDVDRVESTIISTLSLVSIATNKSKSNPQGSFQLTLAPSKNWVSTITPGSWCVVLMSNEPLTESDLKKKADPKKVKMIGKIESVRVDVSVGDDGARRTQYMVTGVDWGYVFNNIIYIDNNIGAENQQNTQGQGVAIAIRDMLFGDGGTPKNFNTKDNMTSLLGIFGKGLKGFTESGTDINRLSNAAYDFRMPREMVQYFKFLGPTGAQSGSNKINDTMTLYCGSLKQYDKYDDKDVSEGFIDPFSLQGQHTFWQLLLENSNPALNEMFCEMRWEGASPRLALYNRMKPFTLSNSSAKDKFKSYFKNVRCHEIPKEDVISVNAGTNWRDKYNFIEVKPAFQSFKVFAVWYKQKSQLLDSIAFQREGFRPLIVQTKQFPAGGLNNGQINLDELSEWKMALKDWYFDTHKMLNGTVTLSGQSQYIGVGDNIMFDAAIVGHTPNMTRGQNSNNKQVNLLAHVESVSHSFSVSPDGARKFVTSVQFVRGIMVDQSRNLIDKGHLDNRASEISQEEKTNRNVVSSPSSANPSTGGQ